MKPKLFIIILVLSVVVWYISRIVQALIELLILKTASFSFYASSNTETGYPIALNISSSNNSIYIYYFLNIAFWFLIIWGIWTLIQKPKKKKK